MFWTIEKLKNRNLRIALRKKGYDNRNYPDYKFPDEVGYIHLDPHPEDHKIAMVLNVDLLPEFHGQGHGKTLYQKALEEAKKLGYEVIMSRNEDRTPQAKRVWDSLVRDGKAERTKDFDVLVKAKYFVSVNKRK